MSLLLSRRRLVALGLIVRGELPLLGPELLDEILERAGLNDLVELGAVVRDQADAFDVDVVHEPSVALLEQPVVDGDLGAVLRDDAGGHGRGLPVHALARVPDLLAAVQLDLRDVRALEEIAEEGDELRTLLVGQRLPVAGERAARDLAPVEDVIGDLPHRAPPFGHPVVALEARVRDDLDHPVDGVLELVRGRAGGRLARGQDREDGRQHHGASPDTCHRQLSRKGQDQTLPKTYLDRSSSRSTGGSTSLIRPFGGIERSEPPGLIRMYFSPISPLVLIDAMESSWSLIPERMDMTTRAWSSTRLMASTLPIWTPAISTGEPALSPPTVGKSAVTT